MTMYVLFELGTFLFAVIAVVAIVFNAITEGDYMKWVIPIIIISLIAGIYCPFGSDKIRKENTTVHTETVQMRVEKIIVDNENSPTPDFYLILFNEKTNKEIEIKAVPDNWIDYSKNVVDVEIITTTFFDEVSQEFKIKEV